jgi:predicted transcriptional regulator
VAREAFSNEEKGGGRCVLTVGTSRKTQVARRFSQLRQTFKVDTQEVRTHAIKRLKELFELSSDFAKGTYKFQYQNRQREPLTIKQRQMWARIAAYIAQIMNTIANGIDERQIDKDLALLEKLVDEATAKNNSSQRKPEDGQAAKTPASSSGQT